MEYGAVGELHRLPRVVGEDEAGRAEGRFLAPPAAPSVVGPRSRLRSELPPAHDLGPDALTPHAEQGPVDGHRRVGCALDAVDDSPIEAGEERPGPADRLVEGHIITGGKAVE